MNILVSAYACEPGKGSEPEVGWQWVHQISRFHETWVITRTNNQLLIEEGMRSSPNPNLHFIYVDLPRWARFWKKGRRGVHFYYYIWQMMVYQRARELSQQHHFDIIHHITFINMYMGPWLALLHVPFVWGPIGANPDIPRRFYFLIGASGVKDNLLRLGIRKLSRIIDPMIFIAKKRAKRILTINEEIRRRLKSNEWPKSLSIPQNAIDDMMVADKPKSFHFPMKILSVGQLVSIKGYRLSLTAFAKYSSLHAGSTLEIIGDGPQKRELIQLSSELGISNSVIFTGQVSRDSVLRAMMETDIFLFPSFEGAGMVTLEAMAKGMPVVCLDFGGPGEYVTRECGIKVPLTEPDQVIDAIAGALNILASDAELYNRLSAGAINRVKEKYLWDGLGDKLNGIYQEVLAQRQ